MNTIHKIDAAEADLDHAVATWATEIEALERLSDSNADEGDDAIDDWIMSRLAITHLFRLSANRSARHISAQPDWAGVELLLIDDEIKTTLVWNWGEDFVTLVAGHGLFCSSLRIRPSGFISYLGGLDALD